MILFADRIKAIAVIKLSDDSCPELLGMLTERLSTRHSSDALPTEWSYRTEDNDDDSCFFLDDRFDDEERQALCNMLAKLNRL